MDSLGLRYITASIRPMGTCSSCLIAKRFPDLADPPLSANGRSQTPIVPPISMASVLGTTPPPFSLSLLSLSLSFFYFFLFYFFFSPLISSSNQSIVLCGRDPAPQEVAVNVPTQTRTGAPTVRNTRRF